MASSPSGAPPGVARLSVVEHGAVIVTRSDKAKTQIVGVVNGPVFPGDYVATTDPATLAELQLDGYTALRLSGGVQLRIASNDANGRKVDVAQGLVELSVLHESRGGTDVVTPPVTIHAEAAGDYRISVDNDGTTTITARRGKAELTTPHKTFEAETGESIVVRGQAANPTVQYVDEVARDAFDTFNTERDRTLFAALNQNVNVPPDIAGYDDLSDYGKWANVQPYGEAWIPNQTAGWAPYRDGTWVWGVPYGWTWVATEPWGWLPYHYGSWFYATGYGWCWYPPAFSVVPVWFPAFVVFFSYGADYGPYGFPYVGWVPLAPYETFYPWYPWYWGYYYPWRSAWNPPIPPPPPPHKRHERIPVMHPDLPALYRNAMHGGASRIDPRAWRSGAAGAPIAVDPWRLGTVAIEKSSRPVWLPVERESSHPEHRVALSKRFDDARFAVAAIAALPLPSMPRQAAAGTTSAWQRFDASQATIPSVAPSHGMDSSPVVRGGGRSSGVPVGGVPSIPVTVEHAPSVPTIHGGVPAPPAQRGSTPTMSGAPPSADKGSGSHGSSHPATPP